MANTYDFSANPNFQLYSPVAEAAATQYGVPSSLLNWQIGAESSWNPNAVNGNAQGIAQFMPATAAQYGVNVNDPVSSIYGAAQYDAALYQKTGDWSKVLSAYGTTGSASNNPAGILAGIGATPPILPSSTGASAGTSLTDIASGVLAGVTSSIGTGLVPGVAVPSAVAGAVTSGQSLLDYPLVQIVTVLAGLILVAAGLYLLKPVQDIVNTTAKEGFKAGGAATLAAVAA